MSCFKSIQVAYNDAFRILFQFSRRCSASEMFTVGVDGFKASIRKCVFRFGQRVLAPGTNGIVTFVIKSDVLTFPRCALIGQLSYLVRYDLYLFIFLHFYIHFYLWTRV